ncbi:unnamed protein product [Callosobruchus maculatus]|uniref:Uncharacterized protein n=1 Tax=Callosobruchus maculatus TaxID=64391 RepID=A0A653D5V3_CALMS|nr:unnamed protein product [Callosobruchus maculatus]
MYVSNTKTKAPNLHPSPSKCVISVDGSYAKRKKKLIPNELEFFYLSVFFQSELSDKPYNIFLDGERSKEEICLTNLALSGVSGVTFLWINGG